MFITTNELYTHLYAENIKVISRDDDTVLMAAIDAATAEAKGYLAAYDREHIFSQEGNNRNALLLVFVKDIAVWHFVNLCNAGTEIELRRHRYDRAVDWLKAVQKGDVSPDFPAAQEEKGAPAGIIKYGSNPKRTQHF